MPLLATISDVTCAVLHILLTLSGREREREQRDEKYMQKLARKPEGRRPFGRRGHRWKDNIGMDLSEIGCEGFDLICLDQNMDQWRSLMNTVMNVTLPQKVGNYSTS
jgi:hypothetical protein